MSAYLMPMKLYEIHIEIDLRDVTKDHTILMSINSTEYQPCFWSYTYFIYIYIS
jgi:hypothetical protein